MAYDMEASVHEALKYPQRIRLTAWDGALQAHRKHDSFRVQTYPYSLEYGFTCQCSGVEEEHRIWIGELKQMVPAAMASVKRIFGFGPKAGDRLRKQLHTRAYSRARALLHRHLTREQRIELRGTRGFHMKDRDGRTYHLTEGSCTNVYIEHEGTEYSLCVVPKEYGLPIPDIMLAQKIMLETDPEAFLRLAHVRNLATDEVYETGGFFLEEEPRPVLKLARVLVGLTPEQVENPREWVEGRLGVGSTEETVERVETRDV